MSPAVTPEEWDDLPPEAQDYLIASGWHPGPLEGRWSFNVCPNCGGLTENLDGQKPHPSWPHCECRANP